MSLPYTLTWINQTPNIINTNDFELYVGIANDNNGNIFIAYGTTGTISGGTNIGGYDIVVAKLSRSGVIQWTKQVAAINTTASNATLSIACDGTNVYIAHHTDGTISGGTYAGGNTDITVAKFDTNGSMLWARQVQTMNTANVDQNPRCAADSAGNVYVAYETNGTVSGGVSQGSYDIALFKLNTSGVLQWIKQGIGLGTSFGDYNASVAVDSSNNVYVAYQAGGTVSGGSNKGGDDIAVAKFSTAGILQWVVQPGGLNTSTNDQNPSIAADSSGNLYVSYMAQGAASGGTFLGGSTDIVVAKLNTSGQVQWVRQPASINTTGYEQYPYIAVDSAGGSYLTYHTSGSVSGGSNSGGDDIVVLKMDTNGNIGWLAQQPGVNTGSNERDPRISVDSLGYVNVAYNTRGTVSGGQQTSNNDIVIMQYAQPAIVNPLHANNALVVSWTAPPLGAPFTSYTLGVTRPWSTGTGLSNANWASVKGNSTGSLLIACPYSTGSAVSLYKSTDNGATWTVIAGSTYIWYTIDVSTDALVIVGTTSSDMIMGRSTNAGSTYTFFQMAFSAPSTGMNVGITGNGAIGVMLKSGYTQYCLPVGWVSGTTVRTAISDIFITEGVTCCAGVPTASSDAIFIAASNGGIKYFSNYGFDGTIYYKYLSELWITKTGTSFSGTISAISLSSGGSRMVVVTTTGNMYIGTLSGTLQVAVTPTYNFIAAPAVMMGLAGGYKNVAISPDGLYIVAGAYASGGSMYVGRFDGTSWNFTPIPNSLSGTGLWRGAYVNNGGSRIHMGREGAQIVNGNINGLVTTASTTSTITGLTNGTSYTVFLTARNSSGVGPFALTTGTPDPLPDAPTSLVASAGDRIATLSWTAAWDSLLTISKYIITFSNGTICGATTGTSTVIRGLSPYTSYTFRVYAVNSGGNGPTATFSMITTTAPVQQTVPFPDCVPWVWFDASDPTTITASGNNVTAWQNKGSGASSAGTRVGTITTGTEQISGRNVISFSPLSQLTVSVQALSSNAFSAFFVLRPTTDSSSYNPFSNFTGQGPTMGPFFSEGIWQLNTSVNAVVVTSGASISSPYLEPSLYSHIIGMTGASGTGNFTRLNGTDLVQDLYNDYAYGIDTTNTAPYLLGRNVNSGGFLYAESIIFSGSITNTLSVQIEGYLAWKWGLQARLPSSHPYSIANCAATVAAFRRPRSFVTTFVGEAGYNEAYSDITCDSSGNIYAVFKSGCRILKISPSGVISNYAGSGSAATVDGFGTNASLNEPRGIAIDAVRNIMYVCEKNVIRRITADGYVSTFAGVVGATGNDDGSRTTATFDTPRGIAVNSTGDLYISDIVAFTIRKISGNTVTTFAGTPYAGDDILGIGTAAQFAAPAGIAFDSQDNLFVCDEVGCSIKKITPDGTVTRFAGIGMGNYGQPDGIGNDAQFMGPTGIYIDKATNYIYIAEFNNSRIRRISPTGIVTTILGFGPHVMGDVTDYIDGIDTVAAFTEPTSITMDPSGSIFIAESNRRIRKANAGVNAQVGTYSQFSSNMDGIAIDNNGTLFVADYDHKIQKIDQHGNRTVFVGDTSGSADGVGTAMRLNTPRGIVIDNYDNLFVMDTNNGSIRKVTKGRVGTTIVGPTGASAGERGHVDGTGTSVRFNYPNHPFVDSENNIYIADSDNYRIRKMTPQGLVTTVAGSGPVGAFDGIGTNSGFSHMWGLYLDKFNNILVSDDSTIRKINMDNFVVVTFAGTGSRGNGDGFLRNAQFNQPCGLTGDNDGNIYITEYGNGLVRRISPTGQVTWFAGGGSGANIDGIGTNARFSEPIDVSFDSANSCLYVSDRGNQRIRVIKVIPQRTISFANNPITGTINMPNGQINFTGLLNFR